MSEPELAGKARSFIGSAQQQLSARGDCSHAHTRRDAHLASLTPLTGPARAQLREARARAQHRLRGALQACGALITCHVIMGAYIWSLSGVGRQLKLRKRRRKCGGVCCDWNRKRHDWLSPFAYLQCKPHWLQPAS